MPNPVAALPGGPRESDFFGAVAAYFTLTTTEESGSEDELPEPSQTGDEFADGNEIGDVKVKEKIEQQQARRRRTEEGARLREKLMRALENIVTAMSADEFISGRSPERLGADIAATALLLRKGLVDRIISGDDFATITSRLWSVLFFGSRGKPSVLQKHLGSCSAEERASFESAIASPRLTAALTLWCFSDWGRNSTDAIKFRFAAMLLAAELPWLITGGTEDEITGELRHLSRAMPAGVEFESLLSAWRNWVQAGVAFREFERTVSAWTAKDLVVAVTGNQVKSGELLWQAGELHVAHANYCRNQITIASSLNRRFSRTKSEHANYCRNQITIAQVNPLKGSDPRKFQVNRLVPVLALLQDPNLLKLHEGVRSLLLDILTDVQAF